MLEDLIDHRSGLLGISSVDSDMRLLRDAASSNVDARLAIEMFCYSVRKQVAAMIAALDELDLLVFTVVSEKTTLRRGQRSVAACPGWVLASTKLETDLRKIR